MKIEIQQSNAKKSVYYAESSLHWSIFKHLFVRGASVIFPLGYKPTLENSSHLNHLPWKMSLIPS